MTLLGRALSQPPVNLKKQKPIFTKAEILQIITVMSIIKPKNGHEAFNKRADSIIKKLNEQLKDLI